MTLPLPLDTTERTTTCEPAVEGGAWDKDALSGEGGDEGDVAEKPRTDQGHMKEAMVFTPTVLTWWFFTSLSHFTSL